MSHQLSTDDQIRLLELGIEINILTADDIDRLREIGILSEDESSDDKPVNESE